jgi:hypothetical protein
MIIRCAFLIWFASFQAIGQSIKNLTPEVGRLIEKSPEGESDFYSMLKRCEELWRRQDPRNMTTPLTSDEERFVEDNCSEGDENYYDILTAACSWYCGGGLDTLTASSELDGVKDIAYTASNAHDLSYKTAWVEGVEGYGIGEFLVYHFPPENPRITKIIVVNGYVKSDKTWRENSRVKQLKMYVNDKPFAILHLEDSKHEQEFSVEPIGNGNRGDFTKLKANPWWTMKFEIVDVYKGEKYADTAITEIYFDGIDVH